MQGATSCYSSNLTRVINLIAVAQRYRYCNGATFTVAVAALRVDESSGEGSAVTFLAAF